MDEQLKEKFSRVMWRMTKNSAEWSWVEFLERLDVSLEDWEEIKKELSEKYNVKTYV